MNSDLEPAKVVLRKFLTELEKIKNIQKSISAPRMATAFSVADKMPIFDLTEIVPAPDSFFEKEEAYTWLYGATRYHLLMLGFAFAKCNILTIRSMNRSNKFIFTNILKRLI